MSNANSCSELRETNTHGVTIIPGIVSPHPLSSSNQDGGSGVSNVSTPNPRAEVEVEFDPNSVSGDQSASRSTSASPGAPLAGVPGGVNLSGSVVDPQTTVVNLSSEALTQEGEPLGPCVCGGCFPGLQLESIPSEGGEKTGSMPALEATRAPPMGTPCGSVYFPPGASSEGRGRYPDLGSRRSNGVPQSPCCGDGMDSPSTPVTGGLAPAFLVTNGTEPAATNRVAPCAEPPRTGEEEEKSQEDVDMVSGDAEGKDSTETEALTDEGNTQIHSEVDGSGDINGQAKPCDTPGEVIQEEHSTNNDNDQSNQDIVDKSVAQGNGAVDPPTAADKIQGDQEQQNAEKANPWTQKAPGKDSASSKKDSKQGNAPKGAKHRNTGAHAVADDDIARCEVMADAFYKDSGDMDAFIENILLTPQSQVYELTVKLGEGYKDWSEKVICDQFVKENPGSLWGSKFPNILIHKKNPQTIVISSYNLSTCVEMGGTTFRHGGKDFLVPKYSRYGNNYYVTFNKVSHPSMAKAIVKKMAALTKSVIAAFNPIAGQNIKSPHLRVIFKSSAPPAVLVPKSGDALREITITDPSGQPFVVVFQHKIAALNKTLPPSIVSRRAEAKAEKAKAKAAKAAAKSPPSGEKEPEHDGDDHDQDPGTNAEDQADSTEASGDGQDEQPQPTAPSHGSDVDMSGDSDPPNNNGQDKQQEDVEMSTNESPALAPPSEQPKNSLDLQLVTGYRSGPAPKRTLPSSPRLDPLPTSNRFHILEEDDVELSFEDFAVPRIVLEDSSAPRPKKTKGKARLPNLPRTPQVKKLSSAAALKMSNANSCSELRETNTHGVTIIPGIVSPHPLSSSNQDGGSGVSNVSTPNPRAEVEVEFDPNSVSGDQSASRSTSASPGAPLAGVPGGVNLSGSVVDPQTTVVNLSSEALTQEGEPLGPCVCGGCFPGLQLESIPSEGGEKTGSMPALEATRAPPMGTPCGSVYFPPGASSEGRGRYPDLGSRRSNGVPQSPCCGDGMDSPSTPVTGGLAPAFLVTNGTEPAATNRVAPCAEPPRTGEEEEKSQEDVDMVSGDAEGKDSTETEALTDEGNTQIHSEVDGSGDINGQAKPCDTPGEVIQEEHSTNNDNDQSNQDIVDKSVAQGNGAVDPPTAADKIQGDQEQQNAEKANPWTQKAPGKDSASSKKDSKQGNAPKGAKHRNTGAHAVADDDIARCEVMADAFYKDSGDMDAFIENILLTPQSQVYELTVKLGEGYKDWSEKVICDQFVKENPGSLWGSKFPNILIHKKNPQTIVISSYNLSTCVEMGGTTFRHGGM
ncbi:hypothetical protein AC1031_014536, partial [Aphanomyces cochlioides]